MARADAGELQARLDLIPIEVAEAALAHRFCKHEPRRSILSFLQQPGEDIAPHQAAVSVLEDLADRTEETALDSVLVYRFIQARELWKDHPDPEVQSAEDFVRCLKQRDFVQALLIMGASVESGKRSRIAVIEEAWGRDWFDSVPSAIRDPRWFRAEQCSRGLLTEVAANAEQGISLKTAVERWQTSVHDRNDMGKRRELRIKAPTGPYLLPSDVAVPDGSVLGRRRKRPSSKVATDDLLRVELIPHRPATKPGSEKEAKPSRKSTPGARPNKKPRRSSVVVDEDTEDDVDDGWVAAKDGVTMRKRVGNQIIYKPIPTVTEPEEASSETPSSEPQAIDSAQSSPPSSPPSKPIQSCDGTNVALILHKFIQVFRDAQLLNGESITKNGCCDLCRPIIQKAMNHLRTELLPCATSLDEIELHRYQGHDVPSSQNHDISPLRPTRASPSLFVDGSSDVE